MKYDVIVIGSGPGGYVAAIRAARLGLKTAVVERSELGGVCLNWGCIPTKALLKSAQVFHYMKTAASYGIEFEGSVRPDMAKIVERSRGVADTMNRGVAYLLGKNNVEVIAGTASLKQGGVVSVALNEGGSTVDYLSENIILATGSRPRQMSFMPIDGKHVISYREAMTLDRIPETMVVVGSGAIGCEFACLYANLGSKVTIIEYMPSILPIEDEDISKQMERSFRKLKMNVMTGTTVKGVTTDKATGKCHVEIEGKKGVETIEADVVLSAIGVKSNLENIGLEELGIAIDKDKVTVDEFYRTNVPGVYAIGDIVHGPALAHVATAEALCCVEKIAGGNPHTVDYGTVPSCVYSTPEVASVGITEKEALAAGMEIKIGKFPFTASGKATCSGERDGFVKLVFDCKTDVLLGAHMVGGNVTEMIAEPTIAKALGATAHKIAATIHPHPTMSEAVMEAAEDAHGKCVHI